MALDKINFNNIKTVELPNNNISAREATFTGAKTYEALQNSPNVISGGYGTHYSSYENYQPTNSSSNTYYKTDDKVFNNSLGIWKQGYLEEWKGDRVGVSPDAQPDGYGEHINFLS